jgi:glycosyltransferase involved in cell wall biosynthesis
MSSSTSLSVAVAIPCYNERGAIGKVVSDFRDALPDARIYVYDNNSTDGSPDEAAAAGAIVRRESRQGKGYVVRRMFADVEADIYLMVDGDDTYEAQAASTLIEALIKDDLDMVSGARRHRCATAYRPGHEFGNRVLTGLVRFVFGAESTDMLTGYRVFSRRFVKSFPQSSGGFEIETELTIHALELQMPTAELETDYKARAESTESKLRTITDGVRILVTIVTLMRLERPLKTFFAAGAIILVIALGLALPILAEYAQTGLVPRFPTAILATGLSVTAFLSFSSGLILDAVTRGRQEAKRMRYLAIPATGALLAKRQGRD